MFDIVFSQSMSHCAANRVKKFEFFVYFFVFSGKAATRKMGNKRDVSFRSYAASP